MILHNFITIITCTKNHYTDYRGYILFWQEKKKSQLQNKGFGFNVAELGSTNKISLRVTNNKYWNKTQGIVWDLQSEEIHVPEMLTKGKGKPESNSGPSLPSSYGIVTDFMPILSPPHQSGMRPLCEA